MKLVISLAFLLTLTVAHAQEADETRASNHDLRGQSALLSIENLDDKEQVSLEKTINGDFWVVYREDGEEKKNKLARSNAEELDQRFAAAFIKVQYELKDDPKGCDADWRLVMRGEEYRFCPKNEQKDQAIRPLFVEMRKASSP